MPLCRFVWLSGTNDILIFMIYAQILFFIFSKYNAVGQLVDQKYTATFSKKILDLIVIWPHLHHEREQQNLFFIL